MPVRKWGTLTAPLAYGVETVSRYVRSTLFTMEVSILVSEPSSLSDSGSERLDWDKFRGT